jgi:hypothetical protein
MAKYLERIDVYNPAHNAIVNLRPARDAHENDPADIVVRSLFVGASYFSIIL